MRISWRRALLAAALSLAAGAAGLVVAAPASAEPPTGPATGTFTVSGDPGEYLTGGETYSYSTTTGTVITMFGNPYELTVRLGDDATGQRWNLNLSAAGSRLLAPGNTYTGAMAYPYEEGGAPGMNLNGNGRVCRQLTGSFTIHDVAFGPYNYLQKLDATFEQHCYGDEPAARGEVHVVNPPAPPLLNPQVTVAETGTVALPDGTAAVHGTLSCAQAATVYLNGHVTQSPRPAVGVFRIPVECGPDGAADWTATVVLTDNVPLVPGDVQVGIRAEGRDPFWDEPVQADFGPTTVRLGLS